MVSTELPLAADTPRQFWESHLDRWFSRFETESLASRRWVTTADLLADDAAHLRRVHGAIMAGPGAPPPAAAAKWVAGWFAGMHARTVGYVHATAGAALLLPAHELRFGLHPDGWADRVDVGDASVAVADGHPWAGLPGVVVVDDEHAVADRAVTSLEAAVSPLLEAVRRLGKVGRNALWTEIADDVGLSLLYQTGVPGDPAVADRMAALLESPAAPWRRHATLDVTTHRGAPVFVGRKAGCCLAYLCVTTPPAAPEASYCGTCSLRDEPGCRAVQLAWHDQAVGATD